MGKKLYFPKIIRTPRPNCIENQNRLRKLMENGNPLTEERMTLVSMGELLGLSTDCIKRHLLLCGTKHHRHLKDERVKYATQLLNDLDL